MDAAEYHEWMAYHSIEPWGDTRMDWRFGMLAALYANVHAPKGRRFAPGDFMLVQVKPERSAADLVKCMEFGVRLHNQIVAGNEGRAA